MSAEMLTAVRDALAVHPGDTVQIRLLSGETVEYVVTHTIEPGHWGVDPYIPSNIIRGEN